MKSGDWLAAGILLITDSAGLVIDKKGGVEFATFSSQWEARACCPEQQKARNLDQICTGGFFVLRFFS